MSVVTIRYDGSATQARETARQLVGIISGKQSDRNNTVARGVWLALAFGALSVIKADYVVKARGGVGEDGVQWPKLTKKYLAYGRRFGAGEQSRLKSNAGLGKSHRHAPGGDKGLLTKAQLQYWQKVYGTRLARFLLNMPAHEAKARAAAIAWNAVKAIGGKTKLEVFGSRQVEILRDTSVLLNSISPGRFSPSGSYDSPSLPGAEYQTVETIAGGVIIGTNVPYAATHQHGDKKRNVPARPFIPEKIPDVWLHRWLGISRDALMVAARMIYGSAS